MAAVDISDLPAPEADISDLPTPPKPSAFSQTPIGHEVGIGENVLASATSGAGSLADALTGAPPGTHDWGYRPRTDAGKLLQAATGKVMTPALNAVSQAGGAVVGAFGGNAPAAEATLRERIPEALGAVGTISALGGLTKMVFEPGEIPPSITEAAQTAADKATSATSGGAAASAIDVSKLAPETQAELAAIESNRGTVNTNALTRVHDAETLPVRVSLTAGQASGDAGTISDEFNLKGQQGNAIGNRYVAQDQALQDNLTTMHREAAPTTVANDPIQNGQAIVDALKRYDAPKRAAITAAYQAAKDANGGDLQMDGSSFAAQAEAALKPQGKARFLPSSAQGIIDDVKASGGQMSLDDFEGYRTALANEARKASIAGDGNAAAAIGKVRDALENTPPVGATSAAAKSLYDNARDMAKARFGEIDADPAYKAAVDDETPVGVQSDIADKFAGKYVLNGSKAALQRLRLKLDDEGSQAVTSSAMNYLQDAAGLSKGKFSNVGYNAGLTKLMPKASELLGEQDLIDNLQQLGRVSGYTQQLNRGTYANTSHTFVAEKAAEIGEHAVNTAAHGLPVGTIARKFLANRHTATAVHEALKPGAGLAD